MSDLVDITGLDKAEVLVALFEASAPLGIGILVALGSGGLSLSEAREMLTQTTYFDYVKGRPLKVSLRGDAIHPALFDRDNGRGSCAAAIAKLRSTVSKSICPQDEGIQTPTSREVHGEGES